MGNFFDDLLGGGDANVQQASLLTPDQLSLQNAVAQRVEAEFGQSITPFQGQRVAGTSPLQQIGFGLTGGLQGGIQGGLDTFSSLFGPGFGQDRLNQAGQLLGQATQPFDAQAALRSLQPAQQLATNQFNQNLLPAIQERLASGSSASGAFNKEALTQAANLSLGLGGQAQGLLFQGQQNALNRSLQGAGVAGGLAQLPGQIAGQATGVGGQLFNLASGVAGVGGVQRGIEQQQLSAEQARFNEAQPFNNPFVTQFLGQALQRGAVENIVTPPAPGFLGDIAGPIGMLVGGPIGGLVGEGIGNLFGGGGAGFPGQGGTGLNFSGFGDFGGGGFTPSSIQQTTGPFFGADADAFSQLRAGR